MTDDLDYHQLHWLQGRPTATGLMKNEAADFQVRETLGFEPDGEGEHVLVRLRKTGCNTPYVAEALAAFAGIPASVRTKPFSCGVTAAVSPPLRLAPPSLARRRNVPHPLNCRLHHGDNSCHYCSLFPP